MECPGGSAPEPSQALCPTSLLSSRALIGSAQVPSLLESASLLSLPADYHFGFYVFFLPLDAFS